MIVTFLGTNGWYDTKTGNTICTLVETDDYFLILDAGNGIHKLDRYISKSTKKKIFLFLSHFHIDHIEGLHILAKFNFNNKMKIFGQPGTIEALNKFVNEPFTVPLQKLPFKVEIHEINEGIHHIPFTLESRYLVHSSRCMGYRFEIEDKIFAYCTDTGISENVVKLAKNTDLLITECSLKLGESNPEWPHLNPKNAIGLAKEANANKIVLTHFDANIYPVLSERFEIYTTMKNKFKNIIIAEDDTEIEI